MDLPIASAGPSAPSAIASAATVVDTVTNVDLSIMGSLLLGIVPAVE